VLPRTRLIIDHEHEARAERAMLDELFFWGIHKFRDTWWSMSCGLCGHSWNEVLHNGSEVQDW
jgi:hypothetical protein